jgi:ABC-type Fe3+/spermidine/putrescine transport system ATPase subunit
MPSVRLRELRKTFGSVTAVRDISVEFAEGKLTSVLGPSGCGKTTTLNLIAGFLQPDGGSIYFGDRPIAEPRRGIAVPCNRRNLGMVFQSYALWPHLTIGENVAYGLKMRGVARAERDRLATRALERVRLSGFTDRYPHELSGGQQQRVALARAIAYSPEILLFDEPLSNLDAQLRDEMRVELKEVHREVGVTAIYVTHDQNEAMSLSDQIIVMGEGEILQAGTPQALYEEPADPRVARFIGKSNVLEATLLENQNGRARVRIEGFDRPLVCRADAAALPGDRGVLSVRPEAVSFGGEDETTAGAPGVIAGATYLGNICHYVLEFGTGGVTIESHQSAVRPLDIGERAPIRFDPERCYFIGQRGAAH